MPGVLTSAALTWDLFSPQSEKMLDISQFKRPGYRWVLETNGYFKTSQCCAANEIQKVLRWTTSFSLDTPGLRIAALESQLAE